MSCTCNSCQCENEKNNPVVSVDFLSMQPEEGRIKARTRDISQGWFGGRGSRMERKMDQAIRGKRIF